MSAPIKQIFNRKMLDSAIRRFDFSRIEKIDEKKAILLNWKKLIQSGAIRKAGEISIHGEFLIDIFSNVLGYKRIAESPAEWNLWHEKKTKLDASKADGALGFFSEKDEDIRVIIELKGAGTDLNAKQQRLHDHRTPVEQAFGYVPKSGKKCKWVIVSNYVELRLYHSATAGEYECFKMAELTEDDQFRRFYYLLGAENLIAKETHSTIDALYQRNEAEQENISKKFYAQYKTARFHLFEHLKNNNADADEILLLEKAQKLLDRFIFVCFCEDTGLLPEKIFRKVVKHARDSFSIEQDKVWTELKGLFRALDKGSPDHDINAFDGGLFAEDKQLDALIIDDEVFDELALLTDYDFHSDLNVNILGHIFEQSITDLEEIRAAIQGQMIDRKKGKRKKEGIYYTPEYITRYIVEHAVGGWLEDRKQELGMDHLSVLSQKDYDSIKFTRGKTKRLVYNKNIEQHIKFWEAYKEKLMNIKVLDPACGSGAFLVQAFDFLYQEGQRMNKTLAYLRGGQTEIFDLDRHILSNNLYGVDLNQESVEITKLSLWLKTANKYSELTALDDNIKCGNSLIDDAEIAGDKAFKWEKEFAEIMKDGGFDAVIGNPPYLAGREWPEELRKQRRYFIQKYTCMTDQYDLFALFIQKAIDLTRNIGYFGFITPNTWLINDHYINLRKWLIENIEIERIGDYRLIQVFEATVLPIVFIAKKSKKPNKEKESYIDSFNETYNFTVHKTNINVWSELPNFIYNLRISSKDLPILKKIQNKSIELEKICDVRFGVKVYQIGKGKPPQKGYEAKNRIYESSFKVDANYYPYLRGKYVSRWIIEPIKAWLKYGEHLAEPRTIDLFMGQRVLIRRIIGKRLIIAPTDKTFIADQLLHTVKPIIKNYDHKFLAGILGSSVIAYYFKTIYNRDEKTFPEIRVGELKTLPICRINFNSKEDISKYNEFVKLVEKILKLCKKYNEVKETQTLKMIQHQINAIEGKIDQLVYQLYGLTDEEIRIVEESVK